MALDPVPIQLSGSVISDDQAIPVRFADSTVIYATSMPGSTMGQKLQSALNSVRNRHKFVVAPPEEIVINSTLYIPSDTTLILYGTRIKLANGVNDRIITNSDYVNGNSNIYIFGFGDAEINGNGVNQDKGLNNYKNIGVHFYKVTNLGVQNVTIASTARWSFVPEACSDVSIRNIRFALEGYENQDGIHIIGPTNKVLVDGVRGTFGDDACVCNARTSSGGTGVFQGFGSGGDITNVVFNDVIVKGNVSPADGFTRTGIFRTSATTTTVIDGVVVSNAIGENVVAAARIGGNATTNTDSMRNITLSNIKVKSCASRNGDGTPADGWGVVVNKPFTNLSINDLTMTKDCIPCVIDNKIVTSDPVGSDIDGLTLSKIRLYTEYNGVNNFIFKFKNATVKNVLINDVQVNGKSDGSPLSLLLFRSAIMENVVVSSSIIKNGNGILTADGTTTMKNVRIRDIIQDTVLAPTTWSLTTTAGLLRNGIGSETANAETPTANKWLVGDIVEFVDSGDASGNGVYQLVPSGTWKKLA